MDFKNRIARLRVSLGEKDLDAIFISQPENRCYLSGFDGSEGYLLITPKKRVLATDSRYWEQAKEQSPDYEIFHIIGNAAEWFPELVAGFSRLGFEAEHLTFSLYRHFSDILGKSRPETHLVPTNGLVESFREVKEPGEIELITRAAALTDAVFAHVDKTARPGMSEEELAWEIERFLRENGSQPVPFDLIVAAGAYGALPHHKPSSHIITPHEPVVIDIGAKVDGYTSDMTRTIFLDGPEETFRKVYDIVLGAQLAALAIIKEDMSGAEADNLARTVIREAGYSDYFGHGLGHGVGLATHELPRLGPNSPDKLKSGMVFTVEPGIYLPGQGGVRIEDMALLENGKTRVISKTRKAL